MHYSCCKYFKILLLLRGRVIDLAIGSLFNASVTQKHKKHKYSTSQVCFYKNLTVFHCKPFRDLQGKPIGYSEKGFMGSPNCQRHQDTLPQIKKPHQQNVDHLCRGGKKQQTRIFSCEQKARPWHRFSPKTHSCFPKGHWKHKAQRGSKQRGFRPAQTVWIQSLSLTLPSSCIVLDPVI